MIKRLLVLLLIITVVTAFVSCKTTGDSFTLGRDNFYANWMQAIKDDTLLKRVVIPGAHDAATANTDLYREELNKDNPNALILYSLSQTICQYASIAELLNSGARYLDLRVMYSQKDGKLYTNHSNTLFQRWSEVVEEILEYIKSSKDFLILDFQHFGKDAEEETLQEFMQAVDFNKYALTTDYSLDTITMGEIKESGKRFAVIWSKSVSIEPNYLFARKNNLFSPYTNEMHLSPQVLLGQLDNYYSLYHGAGLFVLQSQCSSSVSANPRVLEDEMSPLANNYILNINDDLLNKTNIIMRDFLDEDNKIPIILSLNLKKGIVISEYSHLFELD